MDGELIESRRDDDGDEDEGDAGETHAVRG
jgi:hypothetical protein